MTTYIKCRDCSNPARPNRTLCQKCSDRQIEYHKKLYARSLKYREMRADYLRQWVDANRDEVNKNQSEYRKNHREWWNEQIAKQRARKKSLGLCRSCLEPLSSDSIVFCDKHLVQAREAKRHRKPRRLSAKG